MGGESTAYVPPRLLAKPLFEVGAAAISAMPPIISILDLGKLLFIRQLIYIKVVGLVETYIRMVMDHKFKCLFTILLSP